MGSTVRVSWVTPEQRTMMKQRVISKTVQGREAQKTPHLKSKKSNVK
jgi:hypothetical protein